MKITNTIFDQALSLPTNEKLGLIEQLLLSLNSPIQTETDELWAAEADNRVEEINKGNIVLLEGEKVFKAVSQLC